MSVVYLSVCLRFSLVQTNAVVDKLRAINPRVTVIVSEVACENEPSVEEVTETAYASLLRSRK